MGQFLTDLPEERIAKYRLMAAHAHESARTAISPEVRSAYTAMAATWEVLIKEYEHTLARIEGVDAAPEARTNS
jgi:hypothetical protein